MQEFKNGETVAYLGSSNIWYEDGTYIGLDVGKYTGTHVIRNRMGNIVIRPDDQLRKPKVKHEGFIGIMEARHNGSRWETGVYSSKEKLKEITNKMDSRVVAIGHVTWEE